MLSTLRSQPGSTLRFQTPGGRNRDNVADLGLFQAVGLQNHIKGLVPRHLDQTQSDPGFDVVSSDNIEAAHVGNDAQHVMDVRILEVQ